MRDGPIAPNPSAESSSLFESEPQNMDSSWDSITLSNSSSRPTSPIRRPTAETAERKAGVKV